MPFTVTPTAIPDVLVLEPKVFGDARGFFYESFNARDFALATGIDTQFVQDNHSKSAKGVLRGLHYQIQHAQGKLVRAVQGRVFDVAVDQQGNPIREPQAILDQEREEAAGYDLSPLL